MVSSRPGISLLQRNATALPIMLAAAWLLLWVIQRVLDIRVSTWVVGTIGLLSIPLALAFRILYRSSQVTRDATRAGAVLPPRWEGTSFAHLDVLQTMLHSLNHGYPGEFAFKKFEELGHTFETNILWDRMYISCDPDYIKSILATNFGNYIKGETFSDFMSSVLGTGVFNSDGDMWTWHRSMTRPFFSKDRISHFDIFDRHAEEALDKLSESLARGFAVDFQDLVSRFTLDSATQFLFGHCVHSLHSPLPLPRNAPLGIPNSDTTEPTSQAQRFAHAFQQAQEVVSNRSWRGWSWPLYEMFEDESKQHMKVVDAFLNPILEDAIRRRGDAVSSGKVDDSQHDGSGDEGETFLDNLVRYTSDPVVLHDEVLNIMIAGRDTTASTLTFAVYILSTHPAVLKCLREEIDAKVGSERRPTYEDIKEMKYLRAFINETLRLYPPVPFNMRYSVKEAVLPNPQPGGKPLYVPPNTPVCYHVLAMHRNTDYWGPDALEFDPLRFLDERLHKYLVPNPYIFLPFNAGPRICLGQQFAYNEVSFFLIKLLQRFSSMELDSDALPPESRPPREWQSAQGRQRTEKIWPKAHLTMYAFGGLWVKMTEADKDVHIV